MNRINAALLARRERNQAINARLAELDQQIPSQLDRFDWDRERRLAEGADRLTELVEKSRPANRQREVPYLEGTRRVCTGVAVA